MKKFSMIRVLIVAVVMLLTGHVYADDIWMVTYFPVPYASYENIHMQGNQPEFTVGARSNTEFTLNLNGDKVDEDKAVPSLKVAGAAVLRSACRDIPVSNEAGSAYQKCISAVNENSLNKLALNTDIYTQTASFGKGSESGDATLRFGNVRIGSDLGGKGNEAADIQATNLAVTNGKMHMITEAFSSDEAAALPGCTEGNQKVQWNELTFNDNTGYFLTCGYEGTTTPGECQNWKWQLASGNLTCVFQDSGTSYEAIIYNTLRSGEPYATRALANGIIQQSQCRTGDTYWNSGDPLYFVEYNASTLCEYHQPTGDGQTCLDILATVGASGSHFSLPYCSTNASYLPAGEGRTDWSPSIDCTISGEITWLSGTNGDNGPQISLYKSVCADEPPSGGSLLSCSNGVSWTHTQQVTCTWNNPADFCAADLATRYGSSTNCRGTYYVTAGNCPDSASEFELCVEEWKPSDDKCDTHGHYPANPNPIVHISRATCNH